MTLSIRDFLFAAFNGMLIGLLAPYIFVSLGGVLPIPYWAFVVLLAGLAMAGVAGGYFLSLLTRPFFFQLAKFGIIGVSNTIIDLGIYSLFIHLSGTTAGVWITVFKTFSVVVAITNSYIWNKYWSFQRDGTRAIGKEFTQFVTVSLIGMVLNVSITTLLVNGLGAPGTFSATAWATTSGAIASFLVLGWNFVGYKILVFKK